MAMCLTPSPAAVYAASSQRYSDASSSLSTCQRRNLRLTVPRQARLFLNLLPVWIEGDSTNAATLAEGEYDFVFSCPLC